MSTGKWAEKDPERPKLTKHWHIGQKVKYKAVYKDEETEVTGIITGIHRHLLAVRTELGYSTCYTFQAAEKELKTCT